MGSFIKHHYVPEVYLKRFSYNNNGDLFSIKIKPFFEKAAIKSKNKSQVCYEKNRYRFRDIENDIDLSIEDKNHIELYSFRYENTELSNLFDLVEHKRLLFISEVKMLFRIILSIKKRNPSYSKSYDEQLFNNILNKNIESLRLNSSKYTHNTDAFENSIVRVSKRMKLLAKQKEFLKDVYRQSLLESENKQSPVLEEFIEMFINSSIMVLRTSPDAPFITSDNPGFTLKDDREVYNLDLGKV